MTNLGKSSAPRPTSARRRGWTQPLTVNLMLAPLSVLVVASCSSSALEPWAPASPQKDYVVAVSGVAADLSVPLIQYEGPKLDTVHPTAAGYVLLSDALADRLLQEQHIRSTSPPG